MMMDRNSLVIALRASLQDAATRFDQPGDLERLLERAAMDMGRIRPRMCVGTLVVEAGRDTYAAPADLLEVKSSSWGLTALGSTPPWESVATLPLPRLTTTNGESGRQVVLIPAPTAAQITCFGANFSYYYAGAHQIGDLAEDTSVLPEDAGILLVRAQAEAMRELSLRGVTKPVRLRDGQTQGLRNAQPAALYDQLMRSCQEQARR